MPQKVSPTLTDLTDTASTQRLPHEENACRTCAASMWQRTPAEIRCYCRVMHLFTWSTTKPTSILACDMQAMEEPE